MIATQALHVFWRAPLFALAITLLVATVVAVNATAFSAVHALRWKALPYADADRLVDLQANLQDFGFTVGLAERYRKDIAADHARFVSALGFMPSNQPRIDEHGRSWRLARVTADFEKVLGIAPALGRTFAADDGETATLVLSDATWRSRFDADPNVMGRVVRLADAGFTVIGVMPAGFVFPDATTDAWRPLVISAGEREQVERNGSVGELEVVARLAPGVSVDQARESLTAKFAADASVQNLIKESHLKAEARIWRERFSATHWNALALLQLAALILLAVVAANLVNLTLDRLLGRARELDIRRALGAGERAILRSVLGDLAPPLVCGLVLGLALTPLGMALLERRGLLPDTLPQGSSFGAIGLFAGMLVALLVFACALVAIVAARGRNGLSGRAAFAGLGRVRPAMLVAQVMLTTALLGGAGLLLRSAFNLASADHGFDASGVSLTAVDPVGVSISGHHFDPATDVARFTPLVEAMRADIASLPGVQHAAIAQAPPFSGTEMVATMRVPGQDDLQQSRSRLIGVGYFAALGVGLSAGREFEAGDAAGDRPVIVDETYRQRYLQGVDPLTAYVELPIDNSDQFRKARIVGVARSVKHDRLDEPQNLATVYEYTRAPLPIFWLIARTSGDPAALAETVRQRLLALAPDTDFGVNKPLSELVAATLSGRRSLLEALGGFAAATLLLAGIGLAAVLSFAIRRRTGELGVRMAIGATPSRIVRLILRQGGLLIIAGAMLGLGVGIPLARLLADRLYGIGYSDATTWCGTFAIVVGVAFLACWLPARRAAATDPIVALRSE